MKLLSEYKNIKECQLIKNQGDLAVVRYILVDELLEERYPNGEYAMVRMTLIRENGIPFADTTQPYELVELLK